MYQLTKGRRFVGSFSRSEGTPFSVNKAVNQAKNIILFADYRDREEDSQAPPDLEPVTPLPADMVGDEVSEY